MAVSVREVPLTGGIKIGRRTFSWNVDGPHEAAVYSACSQVLMLPSLVDRADASRVKTTMREHADGWLRYMATRPSTCQQLPNNPGSYESRPELD